MLHRHIDNICFVSNLLRKAAVLKIDHPVWGFIIPLSVDNGYIWQCLEQQDLAKSSKNGENIHRYTLPFHLARSSSLCGEGESSNY